MDFLLRLCLVSLTTAPEQGVLQSSARMHSSALGFCELALQLHHRVRQLMLGIAKLPTPLVMMVFAVLMKLTAQGHVPIPLRPYRVENCPSIRASRGPFHFRTRCISILCHSKSPPLSEPARVGDFVGADVVLNVFALGMQAGKISARHSRETMWTVSQRRDAES